MFSKVLIANRGAIAVRIIETLRRMGVGSVAVYSEADAQSRHVRLADEAWSLGEGAAAQTYLAVDKLFEIARRSGAQAIHPGYGFLSENAEFAQRCAAEGIVFLGPTPEQMRAFGLKHSARALAEANAVPLLPGTGLLEDLPSALAAAETIGYPVMLKSTAGGGGIGMSLCRDAEQLSQAWAGVRRLAANNFADAGVFLEKFVERARHIEVQVFGDGRGGAIALGERDCSAQRRNQKVIEETPAPGLRPEVRAELQAVARRLLAAVNYRSAGTVEFVLDQETQAFWFLEVNTRLQVEHGVTEQVYGVDLVRWMVELGADELPSLDALAAALQPCGHAIQVRVYAEDPQKDFRPSAGLLSHVVFPAAASGPLDPVAGGKDAAESAVMSGSGRRIDHWIETGIEVSPFFDPMLAKVIVWGSDRESALRDLDATLAGTELYGIETNLAYLRQVIASSVFRQAAMTTRTLNSLTFVAPTIDVLAGGTLTTIQDWPGRTGYWAVGVPPSGPFDAQSFAWGNRLLGNAPECAGLEITLQGPTLQFNHATQIVVSGAAFDVQLDGQPIPMHQVVGVRVGQRLQIGRPLDHGARCYLLVSGGIDCPSYLGSRATFTLGQFGGHNGRALRAGDVLHGVARVGPGAVEPESPSSLSIAGPDLSAAARTSDGVWPLRVIYGPHGAPDFFTEADIQRFFAADWEVHYNSSRTGIRLIGPKPEWARPTGGDAGMHPSNIHDNAYAFGTIDFTGDMPVILGPDGPSLGGFVCPATVIKADLWKLGQLKAGDRVRFIPVTLADANRLERLQRSALEQGDGAMAVDVATGGSLPLAAPGDLASPILRVLPEEDGKPSLVFRAAGDHFLLLEYGPLMLDIALRFRVHVLMQKLEADPIPGILELTPGIRSLQVHYDPLQVSVADLLERLVERDESLGDCRDVEVPARIVHLPLSWDDEACQLAIRKYMQSVRKNAPWCPSNLEFIRRINGLPDIEAVKRVVFEAAYLVMGLGDVYLGAPVATPVDPRHRLVTTKYNPARTWTAENSVGIGGAYLCVYGMEGPGGYQFVGRTLQMWNRHRQTREFEQPWLLRFFDQIRFFEVSAEELQQIRRDFPAGRYPLRIESTRFSLAEYQAFLDRHAEEIATVQVARQQAFDAELAHWVATGQVHFENENTLHDDTDAEVLPAGHVALESHVAGNVWQINVKPGDVVREGQTVLILESMKMEIELTVQVSGVVERIVREPGQTVTAGQTLMIIREES